MSKFLDKKGLLHTIAKIDNDFAKKSDLTKEKLEIILHGEHTYRANSVDNGNGTHTTTYTCTNTDGKCNARTYTETTEHIYTSHIDGDVIIYTCNCGATYTEFAD